METNESQPGQRVPVNTLEDHWRSYLTSRLRTYPGLVVDCRNYENVSTCNVGNI